MYVANMHDLYDAPVVFLCRPKLLAVFIVLEQFFSVRVRLIPINIAGVKTDVSTLYFTTHVCVYCVHCVFFLTEFHPYQFPCQQSVYDRGLRNARKCHIPIAIPIPVSIAIPKI